jgi:hypothetical protein
MDEYVGLKLKGVEISKGMRIKVQIKDLDLTYGLEPTIEVIPLSDFEVEYIGFHVQHRNYRNIRFQDPNFSLPFNGFLLHLGEKDNKMPF